MFVLLSGEVSDNMERVHSEQCEDVGSRCGLSTIQRQMTSNQLLLSPSLCPNSPFRKVCDETLQYMSGIFDDTIQQSFSSDRPDPQLGRSHPDVISGLRRQNKVAYSSLLCSPLENCHSVDFSMSVTSPPDDCVTGLIETHPEEGMHDISSHCPESTGCSVRNDTGVGSNNSTLNRTKEQNPQFDSTKDLKPDPGFNSTKDLKPDPGFNSTEDLKPDPEFNSTKDLESDPGFNSTRDLKADPGFNSTKDLESDPGFNSTRDLKPDAGFNSTRDLKPDPGFNSTKDLKPDPGFNSTRDLESDPGFNSTRDLESDPGFSSTRDLKSDPGFSSTRDLKSDPGFNSTRDVKPDPGFNSTRDVKPDPGFNSTRDIKSDPGFNSTRDLESDPGFNSTRDVKPDPGFNSTRDIKPDPGFNSTRDLKSDPGFNSTNLTFEKAQEQRGICTPECSSSVSTVDGRLEAAHEKHSNLTVDVCGTSSSLAEKLDQTVDIILSQQSITKQPCSESLSSGEDRKKHGTFIKTTEETSRELTVDVDQNPSSPLRVSSEADEQSSANRSAADKNFLIHNLIPEVPSAEHLPNLKNDKVNTTMNVTKILDKELPAQSDANVCLSVDRTQSPDPPEQLCVRTVPAPLNPEAAVCSKRTLDHLEVESRGEGNQEHCKRRNAFFELDSCRSLDISQSSVFSLDEPLEMRSFALVTSTPIVLDRGFDRLTCAKPKEMQKRLSAITSIDADSNNDLAGVSGSGIKENNPPCAKSESTVKDLVKCTASNSSTSESAIAHKPPSKCAVRRKIPQPSFKSSIPKTQIPTKPSASQVTAMVAKSKTGPAAQALNPPETSLSALHGVKKTVQLNKGKKLAPVKNATARNVKTSFVATSTSGYTLTTGLKVLPVTQPKPCELQPSGRGRFGLKPPGVAPTEAGYPTTDGKSVGISGIRTRSSLLPAFAQKHASSDTLQLAKRKRTDMLDQLSRSDPPPSSKPHEGAQSRVAIPKDMESNNASHDCTICTLLKEKIKALHQELGGILEDIERRPAGCNWLADWLPFQLKYETNLAEFKRLQAEHH